MGYERKRYIRVIKRTTTVTQIWDSTAGKPEYIEKDGNLLLGIEGETEITFDNGFVLVEAPEDIAIQDELVKAKQRLREYET